MDYKDILTEVKYRIWHIRKCFRFMARLISYIPVIWKNEDWDYDYLYDLIEFKLTRMEKALRKDNLHLNSNKYAQQIRICLAYLDRYRNWTEYIEYPIDDIDFEPCGNGCMRRVHKNSINEAKRKKVYDYEKFHYTMFWKRFMQWHQNWWC